MGTGHYLDVRSFSPYISELKEKDPCYPLAHRGSSTVGEGHQEHHRGPGTMCLQHCSWGQLLKGKILLQEKKKERTPGYISRDHISAAVAPRDPTPLVSPLLRSTSEAAIRALQGPDIHVTNTRCPSCIGNQRLEMEEWLCSPEPGESAEQPHANKGHLAEHQQQMAGNT